jgi:cytochrome c oxidase cbb3-type subunit 3
LQLKNKIAVAGFLLGIAAMTASQVTAQGGGGRGGRGASGAAGGSGGGRGPAIPAGGGGGGFANSYPTHPQAAPEVIARGKVIYDANCASCHAADMRGTDAGINIIRKQVVMDDDVGELIAPILKAGHPAANKKVFNFDAGQIVDLAGYIHSKRAQGYDASRNQPDSILVGNAAAGEAAFKARCGKCHSVAGDLKGFGAKFLNPQTLQNTWIMPGAGGRGSFGGATTNVPPATVTVTMANGKKLEGRLGRIDDFIVILTDADGVTHTVSRNGNVPKVDITDPLADHRQLMRVYTDKEIHDITAYLVTVK